MVGLHGNLGSFANLHRDKNMTRPKIGIWSVIRDSLVIEAIAAQLDFIILDLEHGFRDFGQFQANFRRPRDTQMKSTFESGATTILGCKHF